MNSKDKALTYRDAGVDIDAGNRLVERIGGDVARTRRPEVLGSLGGFGGLFELDVSRYKRPVLVGATDGVGTKLRLALATGKHDTIGIDLVAMCVNDVIVQGAEPLFFLDYYATGKLDVDVAASVIAGIARGCELAGAALIGGETAEMPGMYRAGDYDLAGFCVGVVDHDAIVTGAAVTPGDQLVAIASSGPHSNGYSLIRRIVADAGVALDAEIDGIGLLADALLAPTRIYVRPLLALLGALNVHALAHITGGGIVENLPRILPPGCRATIDLRGFERPAVFRWLQAAAGIDEREMLRTFNCGVGMIAVVAADALGAALSLLATEGERAWHLGEIRAGTPGVDLAS